jgi:hypothetical protein
MAVLNELIEPSGFEKVANRITEILAEEIENQKSLQGFTENVEYYIERIEPFQRSQEVSIQVYFKGSVYENYTQQSSQGECQFYIDLYTSSLGKGDVDASIISKNKNYRYLGLIRYILSSGKLATLGFPPGLIGGKYVKTISQDIEFANFGADPSNDGSFIRFSRVLFVVKINECQSLWEGIPLAGSDTNFKYECTDKGTKVIFNN